MEYPTNWREIATLIKASNHWQCQNCGLQCRRPGEPFKSPLRTLTVAHYDHDYLGDEVFLVALCTLCHLRHDCGHTWPMRRYKQEERRRAAGQLRLLA